MLITFIIINSTTDAESNTGYSAINLTRYYGRGSRNGYVMLEG
jgi:hypothetical protein